MLARSLILRQTLRFCTKGTSNQPVVTKASDVLIDAQKKEPVEIPLYLQPYNRQKYEVPMKKIKKNSGYALVQIEPFPRARIMKICYNILAEVRKGIPEDFFFRILMEERTKYIMEVVDREEDVVEIQRSLTDGMPIEIYIRNLADQLDYVELMRKEKFWERKAQLQNSIEQNYSNDHEKMQKVKNPLYKKSERPKATFI